MIAVEFFAFGDIEPDMLARIAGGAESALDARITIAPTPMPLPERAYDARRGQYQAGALIATLASSSETHGQYVLGVADVDLYASGLNFVFGQARPGARAAVISLARLRGEFWGDPPDEQALLDRAIKEAVHELGHTLGLRHCPNPDCVMHFSNRLADTDRKSRQLCDRCGSILAQSRS